MEQSGDEDRPRDEEAGDPPSRSAQVLARTRAALEARRERDAIRLRHPAFRNNDAQRLMLEASEIAIAAGLAMEGAAHDPVPPRPEPVVPPRPPAAVLPTTPPGADVRNVSDRAPEPEPVAAPSSRWDTPAPSLGRRIGERALAEMASVGLLKAGFAAVLLAVAGGAVYAGFLVLRTEEPTSLVAEPAPPVAERAPAVLELPPVRVRTIRIPVPSGPDATAAGAVPAGLSLRGGIPGFAEVVPGAPAEACATLVAAGWSTEGWGNSPVGAKGECLAERRYGVEGETNSFVVLRGGHTLAELRIKLNLGDPDWRAEAGRDAGRLVAILFERWRWEGGNELADRIAALRPFEVAAANGTTVRLTREHGEVERLNLLLRFPQPLRTPGAGVEEARAAALAALSAIVAAHVGGTQAPAEPAEPAEAGPTAP